MSPRLRLTAIALMALIVVAGAGIAMRGGGSNDNSTPAQPITISGQYATASTNDVAAVYFTIKNSGSQDDTLLSVATDSSPDASLHQDVTTGITSSMKMLQDIVIPAKGQLEMKPSAYHVMMSGLTKPLEAGTTVTVHVTLQKAGTISFTAPVKALQ